MTWWRRCRAWAPYHRLTPLLAVEDLQRTV